MFFRVGDADKNCASVFVEGNNEIFIDRVKVGDCLLFKQGLAKYQGNVIFETDLCKFI